MKTAVLISKEILSLDKKKICISVVEAVPDLNKSRDIVFLVFSLIVWKIFKLSLTHPILSLHWNVDFLAIMKILVITYKL